MSRIQNLCILLLACFLLIVGCSSGSDDDSSGTSQNGSAAAKVSTYICPVCDQTGKERKECCGMVMRTKNKTKDN